MVVPLSIVMKKYILILLWAISTSVYAQELSHTRALSLGISPSLNRAIVPDYLNGGIGVGLAFFADYKTSDDIALSSKISASFLLYDSPDSNFTVNTNVLGLELGLKKYLKVLDNSAVVLRATPSYVFGSRQNFQGRGAFTAPSVDLNRSNKNQVTVGLYAGFELNFKERSTFEIGYNYSLNQQKTDGYIDAVPHHIKLAYNINFLNNKKNDYGTLARETLGRLANDTLYFINRACPSDFTTAQLDSILKENYTYSAYKIIADNEISRVSLQPNVVHFAIIGKYYASEGDPATNGIYLLNKDLQLTEKPYPFYTANGLNIGVKDNCFGGTWVVGNLVSAFNRRLSR